jgi:hypothetical protein
MAQCAYCGDHAGLLSKVCKDCKKLLACFEALRGRVGYGQFLTALEQTGVPTERIARFLKADPDGHGSVQDQITAEMASELMQVMGLKGSQTAQDVKKVREMTEKEKG